MALFSRKSGRFDEVRSSGVQDIVEVFNSPAIQQASIYGDHAGYHIWREEDEDEIFIRLVQHFSEDDKQSLAMVHQGQMTKEDFMKKVDEFLTQIQVTGKKLHDSVILRYEKYTWGYYVLDDLITKYPDISDINVVAWNNIRVKRNGKRMKAEGVTFKNHEDLITFLNHVAVKNKVSLSDINAQQTFTDKETVPDFILRFSVITKYLTSSGTPYISIRKIPKTKYTMDQLVGFEMFDDDVKEYLKYKAQDGNGILFTGKGASGKTTLMNTLIEEMRDETRTMVIQENEELFSMKERDMMFVHVVTNRGDGKISYNLADLARSGLLNDLDRFIIGEIKGDEAGDFLMAAYTGHSCWASVHGINSFEAMDKLVDYAKHATSYSKAELMKMVHYIDTVIFMKQFKVQEVAEIVGYDEHEHTLIYRQTVEGGHFIPGITFDPVKRCIVDNRKKEESK